MLGDIGLQPDAPERLSGGTLCAACLLHAAPVQRKMRSLTQACACFQLAQLSTEIVHNHVDSGAAPSQSMMCCKGLHQAECLFASDVAKCAVRGARRQSLPALNMVAVTRLRPECLLR
ncbi:MAG TPA: hypothetical protein VGH75_10660, partial [Steroidobacteraceae bacterium]